jgi:hypothetical protein
MKDLRPASRDGGATASADVALTPRLCKDELAVVSAPIFYRKAAIVAAAKHCGADMSSLQPDLERDVIVRHTNGDPQRGDQWAVFLGSEKRVELVNEQGAMVFARLLADLQQRRVWIGHGSSDDLVPISEGEVRGCPCC